MLKPFEFSAYAELVEALNRFGQQPVEIRPQSFFAQKSSSLFLHRFDEFFFLN
jgi:hypothetical protein